MDTQWSVDTHGDPLGAVRALLKQVWLNAGLDGMLVTLEVSDAGQTNPHYASDVDTIDQLNPFLPLMEVNAARLIPGLLAEHQGTKVGALLRPCELRALVEMTKHSSINLAGLLTISVDCLGTLPSDEYQWRRERIQKGHPGTRDADALAEEALQFARQGGIIPYRYRSACQVCESPAAGQADINIHVLGLPVRQSLLVSVHDPQLVATLHLDAYAHRTPDNDLLLQHERALTRMNERHALRLQQINESLGDLLPADVDALIRQLESCGDCQGCMDACPICSVDRPRRSAEGHYDRTSVMRWLVSCAGCGMCEQSCARRLPTAAIFTHIRQQLDAQWDYAPGKSSENSLPV